MNFAFLAVFATSNPFGDWIVTRETYRSYIVEISCCGRRFLVAPQGFEPR
jgi:hypothetical protein